MMCLRQREESEDTEGWKAKDIVCNAGKKTWREGQILPDLSSWWIELFMSLKCDVQTGHVEGDCFGCVCEEPEKASLQIERGWQERSSVHEQESHPIPNLLGPGPRPLWGQPELPILGIHDTHCVFLENALSPPFWLPKLVWVCFCSLRISFLWLL